jgi:hypothetical protein
VKLVLTIFERNRMKIKFIYLNICLILVSAISAACSVKENVNKPKTPIVVNANARVISNNNNSIINNISNQSNVNRGYESNANNIAGNNINRGYGNNIKP